MRVYVVDAFTDVAFAGNPAGVVVLDASGRDDADWMQRVAAELKHSETAFVRSLPDGRWALRWFTPAVEVDLCGHATLATAHVLIGAGAAQPVRFMTRSGELVVERDADASYAMDFPAQPVHPTDVPDDLEGALGATVVGVYGNGVDLLVEVGDAAAVTDLRPDLCALARLDARGVIVTARADADADHHFVSRFFAPRVGVPEDPVTGSAHCALGPFWAQRLGRADVVGVQVSQRSGRVTVSVRGNRVVLRGDAVTVLEGALLG